jgi:hypothetical protein
VDAVLVDGVAVAPLDWNKPVAVDPDRPGHAVELRGKAVESRVVNVTTGAAAAIVRVDVPVLEPAHAAEPAHPEVVGPASVDAHPTRTVGIVVGGAGVAALAVGGIFGALTLSEKSAAQTACPGTDHVCTDPSKLSDAQGHHSTAETDSWVSTIGLGVGVVGVGLGAYLLFRHASSDAASVHLVPTIGRDGGAMSLIGHF